MSRLTPRLRRVLLPAQSALLLRTTAPIGKNWGWDRGTPVDRFYIESFLERHRRDISGRVLEIKDASYTRRFGRGVTTSDVLDVNRENSGATIYADLAAADEVPSDAFDCIILTQTLQFIFDIPAALTHLHRVLASEGVVLATVPTVSRVAAPGSEGTDYWRFTPAACAELFDATFGADNVLAEPMGNVLANVAFLHGLGAEELPRTKLEQQDVEFPLVVGVRAAKRA